MKNYINKSAMTAGLLMAVSSISWANDTTVVVEPTQQELDAINQSDEGLEVITHADGSKSVDLKGRFQMFSTATVVDGKVVYSCQNKAHNHTAGTVHKKTEKTEKRGIK